MPILRRSGTAYPTASGGGGSTQTWLPELQQPLIGALGSLVRTDEPNTVAPTASIPTAPYTNPQTGMPWGPGLFASSGVATTSSDPYQIPVYQVQSQQAPADMQKLYGTAAMPMFEFARKVQTGEVTIDPESFQAAADSFEGVTDAELLAQGVQPTTRQYIAEIAGGAAQAVVGTAGQMAARTDAAPFSKQLIPAAKSYLPESLVGPTVTQAPTTTTGYAYGLQTNVTAIPRERFNALNEGLVGKRLKPISASGQQWTNPDTNVTYTPVYTEHLEAGTANLGQNPDFGKYGKNVQGTGSDPDGGYFDTGESFKGYAPSWGQTGLSFGIGFAANLAGGMKVKDAAKSAAIGTAGMYVGTLIGGPIGGVVGGMVANFIGGRVVCNELRRQGQMSKEMVLDDYRFTRDFLSPGTVRGYHVWAIPVVRQMRKGRFTRIFKHLCVHRGNEIAYIYGKRDKPDYLGKVYRQLLEKLSWFIGLFCEASDWSILYKEKEV